jgi:hypothetical protein
MKRLLTVLTIEAPTIFAVLTAVMAAVIGFLLLRVAGAATREVIPQRDYALLSKLILDNNQDGIDNYVKLSGLTGFVGFFSKMGLYGLPLATILLTIILAMLGLVAPSGQAATFFDLSKLTLGAFIGSYVQRQRATGGDSDSNARFKDQKAESAS